MRSFVVLAVALSSGPAMAQVQMQPGQYETTNVIESINMPGLPPQVIAMMKGKSTTMKICITEADVKNDPKKMLAADKSCEMKRYNLVGGKLDAEMACKMPQGAVTMTMTGTYTPISYVVQSTMRGGMNIVSRTSARRLGPCK